MSRVLVIGGYPRSLMNFRGKLLEALRARGHEVLTCAGGSDPATQAFLEQRGIRYFNLPLARVGMNPFSDLLLLVRLVRLMRREQPDVVLGYTVKPVIYGMLAARLAGVRRRHALITGLGYAFAENGRWRQRLAGAIARGLYRLALRGSPRVIFQNDEDRDYFYRHGLLAADAPSVRVMGTGVDLGHYAQAPLSAGPVTFLFMARLLVEKGVRDFAAAARALKPKYPQVRFALLGRLDANPHCITRAELDSWLAAGFVEHWGETPDVRGYLAETHVFVLPTYYLEGVPRSIQEAMATGRPVITTDMPGCRDTVEPGVNGFLVPPRDPRVLAGAMESYIKEPALIVRHGAASRERVARLFDVERVNVAMLAAMNLD